MERLKKAMTEAKVNEGYGWHVRADAYSDGSIEFIVVSADGQIELVCHSKGAADSLVVALKKYCLDWHPYL